MTAAADRMRASRARRAAGRFIVRIEASEAFVDLLVEEGFLGVTEADDVTAIARAIERVHALLLRATPSLRETR